MLPTQLTLNALQFLFRELPPRRNWELYGLTGSFGDLGAVPQRQVFTPDHGHTNDLGDILVRPAISLSGRLVPTPGGQLSRAPITIVLNMTGTADSQSIQAGADGRFMVQGLYPGTVNLKLNSGHWRISMRNRSIDPFDPFNLTGRIPAATTNLLIEIEAGVRRNVSYAHSGGMLPSQDLPQNRSLGGVEPGPYLIKVTGGVVDEKTGQPIARFEVLPGRQPPILAKPPKPFLQRVLDTFRDPAIPRNELPFWYTGREERVSNGRLEMEFERLTSDPLILITASGYEPMVVGPIITSTNGLIVRMTRGGGPAGVVLLPDGRPAAGAQVIYAAKREQFQIDGQGRVSDYGAPQAMTLTDAHGAFSFPRRLEGLRLIASRGEGWLIADESDLGPKMKLRLEPWAVVEGDLVDTNGVPAPNEELMIRFNNVRSDKGYPLISIASRMRTGANGHFVITNVPPGSLDLMRLDFSPSTPGGPPPGWSARLQTRFHASPGVTNDLGKVTLDTPPPEPLLKQLEKKIGL